MKTDHSIELRIEAPAFIARLTTNDAYVVVGAPENVKFLGGKTVTHALAICRKAGWKVRRVTPLRVGGQ